MPLPHDNDIPVKEIGRARARKSVGGEQVSAGAASTGTRAGISDEASAAVYVTACNDK